MKIGLILISNGWAGAENSVYNLSKYFIRKNEVNLFINEEIIKYFNNVKPIKIYNLGKLYFNKKYLIPKSFYKIRRNLINYLKKNKIDILILFLQDSSIVSYKINKEFDIPTIITLRGQELEVLLNKRFIINKYFLKKALEDSNLILSLGSWQLKHLPKIYLSKSKFILNGINLKIFKQIDIKRKERRVLFTGRYIDHKGIRELLNIAKQLPQYEFWFAGQGPLKNIIKGKNIKDFGFKTQKELVKLYNQTTICTFPSYSETFGNVGLEAMACGKPVIATPLGFSEYIEDGKDGIIIPTKNEKALKEAIVKLMENPKLREKLGKAARKKAEQYSWEKIAKRYLELFKETIEKKKLSQKYRLID